jgi:hypothetical protein
MISIVPQRCADLPDGEIESLLKINKSIGVPYLPNDFFSVYKFARVAGQQYQEAAGLFWQFHANSTAAEFTGVHVQLETVKRDTRSGTNNLGHGLFFPRPRGPGRNSDKFRGCFQALMISLKSPKNLIRRAWT